MDFAQRMFDLSMNELLSFEATKGGRSSGDRPIELFVADHNEPLFRRNGLYT